MTTKAANGSFVLNWQVTPDRKIVQVADNLFIYLLWRNEAYNLWTPLLPNISPVDNYTSPSATEVIVKAGYLIRSATVSGNTLALTGDLNATVPIEVIGAPQAVNQVTFNGEPIAVDSTATTGALTGTLTFQAPDLSIPDLSTLDWKYLDSLPEIQSNYDDSAWTNANVTPTPNSLRNLTTPTSLYVADYGFGPGTTLFRGHFTAMGLETQLTLQTQGGSAFASSVFLDSTFIGSWDGNASYTNYNSTFSIPPLTAGTDHIFTILNDNQGLEEDGSVSSLSLIYQLHPLRSDLSTHTMFFRSAKTATRSHAESSITLFPANPNPPSLGRFKATWAAKTMPTRFAVLLTKAVFTPSAKATTSLRPHLTLGHP